MLIKALCDYYKILEQEGKLLREDCSRVKIHYFISLNEDGTIDDIIEAGRAGYLEPEAMTGKDKAIEICLPRRTEKSGIKSNILEHREVYIFGLLHDGTGLVAHDRTGKARKSHEEFVKTNLKFIEGLHSSAIDAFRNFLLTWNPEVETKNPILLKLGKDFGKAGYGFCLKGYYPYFLDEDPKIWKRWEVVYKASTKQEEGRNSQCAVYGEVMPIARIHNKIKGVYGGIPMGTVLIGCNNESEESYGNKQSYNSNISETAMRQYTKTLNYLLKSKVHNSTLEDMTVLLWTMGGDETCEGKLMAALLGESDVYDSSETEQILKMIWREEKKSTSVEEEFKYWVEIKRNKQFDVCVLGIKPNASRISAKFFYRKKYSDILWNLIRFQKEVQSTKKIYPVSICKIVKELKSPKSRKEITNPDMLSKFVGAVLTGAPFPRALLETAVRRVKTDGDYQVNRIRAGIIRAWINRNGRQEELHVVLDLKNTGDAYLCGRLFAILEKLQQDALGVKLTRTIKDAYFASASSRPAGIFPKLVRMAEDHLKKVRNPEYYLRKLRRIKEGLRGEFPEILLLPDQGRFIVGYYHQYNNFYDK